MVDQEQELSSVVDSDNLVEADDDLRDALQSRGDPTRWTLPPRG